MELAKSRVAVFVDGFNLYHAINDLNLPHLKWVDLSKLATHFVDLHTEVIVGVHYFSAFAKWKQGPYYRHKQYVKALKAVGVKTHLGAFQRNIIDCRDCGREWEKPEEKQTDVRIGVHLVHGAYKDEYDTAILLSCDSDFVPAVEMVVRNTSKRVRLLAPPHYPHSKNLAQLVGNKALAKIKQAHLEWSLLPQTLRHQDSATAIIRPAEYDPPAT